MRRGSFAVNTIGEVTETLVAPLAGEMLTTVGAVVSGVGDALVVKELHHRRHRVARRIAQRSDLQGIRRRDRQVGGGCEEERRADRHRPRRCRPPPGRADHRRRRRIEGLGHVDANTCVDRARSSPRWPERSRRARAVQYLRPLRYGSRWRRGRRCFRRYPRTATRSSSSTSAARARCRARASRSADLAAIVIVERTSAFV